MTTTDGLNIQQIQDQWKESQNLIVDLRSRLEALASASESAAAATTSIRSSEKTLASLAAEQQEITKALAEAQEAVVKTLQGVHEAALSIDAGRLSQQMTEIQASLSQMEKLGSEVKAKQASQDDNLAAILSILDSIKKEMSSAVTSKDDLASKEEELNDQRKAFESAVATLPGRYQNRVRDAL